MFHDGIRVSSSEQNFQLVTIFFWSEMNDLEMKEVPRILSIISRLA